MSYQQAIASMSPAVYRSLKRAVETGRWPDGRPLSQQQRQDALQAVIAWDNMHLPEQERVGYINRGHKAGSHCDDPAAAETLKWRDDNLG